MKTFTLYARHDCHLCELMQSSLTELKSQHEFAVEWVDVDSDPALELKYGFYVPVLMFGDIKICHYHFDLERFLAALSA